MKRQLAVLLSACMFIGSGAVSVQAEEISRPDTDSISASLKEENLILDGTEEEPADQTADNTDEPESVPDGLPAPDEDISMSPGEDGASEIGNPVQEEIKDENSEAGPAAEEDASTAENTVLQETSETFTQQIIDGKKYMVASDGTHYTGWYQMTDKWTLYFNPDDNGAAVTGVFRIRNSLYLFDHNGILRKGPGTPVIDGSKYYINGDGTLQTGWVKLGDWTMYFDEETGEAYTGLSEIGGKLYLFSSSGILHEEGGTPVINGKKYWMNADGSLGVGWKKLGSWTMYFDKETGEAHTGISEADGSYYLFNKSGILREGSGTPVIDGKKYWMNKNSSLNSGWLDMGSIKMYFDPVTFEAAEGVTTIEGKKYAFDGNGCLLTGRGTPVINGKKYCFNSDGTVNTGWYTLGSWTMYFDPQTGAAAVGVVTIDGKQYYFNASGVKQEWMATKAEQYAYDTLNKIGWNLRAAYNWAAEMPYYRMSQDVVPTGADPTQWYAEFGFENHTGNCYVMASTFYYMAKLLGYDVHRVNGYVPISLTAYNPHGWCEIDMNGTTYVFDPNFTNEMHMNGYQITYGTSGTWRYSFYSRIN